MKLLPLRRRRLSRAAFSLVEVAMALGIMAFAFVAVFGLIPVGLNTFQQAKITSVANTVAQREISELQQMDFDQLPIAPVVKMYNDNGQRPAGNANDNILKTSTPIWSNVRVLKTTPVPGSTLTNNDVAMITVQVAHNPREETLAYHTQDPLKNLWNGALQSAPSVTGAVPVFTYNTYVARNKIQ